MNQLFITNVVICFLLLSSCRESILSERDGHDSILASNHEIRLEDNNKHISSNKKGTKTYNGISYSFHIMNASDFISKKGEKVEAADQAELNKESVMIVTFSSEKKHTDIFELEQMTLNKEDAVQYLIGALGNDVTIEQDGKSIKAKGVHYESSIGEIGQLRAFLFFDRIRHSSPVKVLFYDRLFGAGLMRFEIQN